MFLLKKKLPMDVVGDVSGRIAIIVVSFTLKQIFLDLIEIINAILGRYDR